MLFLGFVLAYLMSLAVVGFMGAGRVRKGDDFLVAGRSLPGHILVFTLLSTWIGAGSIFAGAGLGYRAGFPALWQPAGAWLGIGLIFFIAPRVRRIAQYTVPDILELRYGPAARVLGSITIVIAYTTIAAYQFRGGGRLLALIAGVEPRFGAVITAAFCITYTALAGMMSIAYLDIGNGLMMIAGVGAAVVYLVAHAGGLNPALDALRPDQLSIFGTLPPSTALALFFPTMFLLLGEANMYQKFFSAKSERAAKWAVAGWITGTILVETLIISIGVFGSVLIPGLTQGSSETIVVRVAIEALPRVLGLMLICATAAIIVSTANSMLLTPATSLTRDVYQRFINPAIPDRDIVLITRILVVVLGAIGFIALAFFQSILEMALWAYTVYGAGITPALLAGFIWPRATRQGGIGSIAAGIMTTVVWEVAARMRSGDGTPLYPFGVETIYPALILSIGTLIAVSLMTPQPTEAELAPIGA